MLADSFFEHHPRGRLAVLIPDDPEGKAAIHDRVEVLRPADIGFDRAEFHRMALTYSMRELSCALKGYLLRHLVEGGDVAVFLDSDILVSGDFSPLAQLARRHGLVLTTHGHTTHATPDRYPPMPGHAPRMLNAFGAEQMLVLAGSFNFGVVAVGRSALPFLDWLNARTARYCYMESDRGIFGEQGWAALAPTLFDCHVMREPGWNVSGFALFADDVERGEAGDLRIAGHRLRCFHFITFDPTRPEIFSPKADIAGVWPSMEERPGAARLCREYAERIMAAGHAQAWREESPYDRLADGTPLDTYMRTAYAEALLRHEAGRGDPPPNPFEDGDAEAFLRWLEGPVEGPAGSPAVSRYLDGVRTHHNWVYGPFREVPGRDARRYLEWLPGAVERGDLEIPARWLPPPPHPEPDPAFQRLEGQYRDLLQALEAHRASRTWRLTAPLRRVASRSRRNPR